MVLPCGLSNMTALGGRPSYLEALDSKVTCVLTDTKKNLGHFTLLSLRSQAGCSKSTLKVKWVENRSQS